jgi:hypothetical protein
LATATKRSFVDDGKMDVEDGGIHDSKRFKVDDENESTLMETEDPKVGPTNDDESDIFKSDPKTIVVKLYDGPDDVNLNDVVEVIGVLSLNWTDNENVVSSKKAMNICPSRNSTFPHIHAITLVQV